MVTVTQLNIPAPVYKPTIVLCLINILYCCIEAKFNNNSAAIYRKEILMANLCLHFGIPMLGVNYLHFYVHTGRNRAK